MDFGSQPGWQLPHLYVGFSGKTPFLVRLGCAARWGRWHVGGKVAWAQMLPGAQGGHWGSRTAACSDSLTPSGCSSLLQRVLRVGDRRTQSMRQERRGVGEGAAFPSSGSADLCGCHPSRGQSGQFSPFGTWFIAYW